MIAIELCERGWLPDALMRSGMRSLMRRRLRDEAANDDAVRAARLDALSHGPVAVHTDKANEQHYEVPAAFYEQVLGRHLKYSACYWPDGVTTLDAAEAAMLALTCERAGLADGMRVLELGCGWGAVSLWIAERYPASRVLAMSNSSSQQRFIMQRAAARGLGNLDVVTADMNAFDTDERFDRVVSIEMFEHMRNYRELLSRIARWLAPGGQLFAHVFCHRELLYPFEVQGESDWMSRYFFTGGIMPAESTLASFPEILAVEQHWRVPGEHYANTANAWLAKLDAHRDAALATLADAYGPADAARWLNRWRMFFMACAELFAYRGGNEWFVGHYRMSPPN